ncbi:MAG: outer membrane beta-barrel protein [Bacteroidales bacterium]|nr:outer membrane beta-barrel protein [Bacteroidales bacterium]
MGKFTFRRLLLITALALVPFSMSAQESGTKTSPKNDFKGHIYTTVELGADILGGDVNKIKPGFDFRIGAGWQFINWLSVKGNFSGGLLRGENDHADGFKIKNGNYLEANIGLNISLIDLIAGYNPERLVSVTPHVGIGTFQYRLKVDNADGTRTNVGIKSNRNFDADYVYYGTGFKERHAVFEVPMGLELGFNVAPCWDIYLDYTATWTDSDILDGHESGSKNDWITSVNIGAKHRILRDMAREAGKPYCSNWFVTLDMGPYFALGDVRKLPLIEDTRLNFNVSGGYKWGRCWKVYGRIGFATFAQDVKNKDTDEVTFTCDFGSQINTDINLGFDIINAIEYKEDRLVSLYLHAGFGMIQYKARGTYKSHLTGLPFEAGDKVYYGFGEYDDDMYHQSGKGIGGRRIVAEVPVGVELNFRLNDHWDIYGDGTVAFYDSDLVNGIVSGTWEDWSLTTNIGVRYNFKKSCPQPVVEEEKPTPQIVPEPVVEEPVVEEPVEEPIPAEIRLVSRDDEVIIAFDLNGWSLDLPENKQTLADFLDRIGDKTITSVKIIAFASPEGSEKLNDELSLKRANVAKDFIMSELKENVKDAKFELEGGGADWAGFMELLRRSNIENKQAIADEINNADSATRYQTLYNISVRQPEIKDLYPTLRRAAVSVKVSTLEEVKD